MPSLDLMHARNLDLTSGKFRSLMCGINELRDVGAKHETTLRESIQYPSFVS